MTEGPGGQIVWQSAGTRETFMSLKQSLTVLGLLAPLGACAINPVPVSALPGPNKDPVAFARDETACRGAASRNAYQTAGAMQGGAPGPRSFNVNVNWQAFFTSYGQCEAARGNLVQPIPWGLAYQLYLGYGYPYPYAAGYPVAAYPYPPPYGTP